MKRMIAVVCAALCLTAALSACGKKEEAQIDLQKVYEAILDAQGDKKDDLVMLEEPEDSGYLDTFYPGLRDIARKQTVVAWPASSPTPKRPSTPASLRWRS